MGKLRNYMVDQFGEPLEIGKCYAMHLTGDQTKATVWYVREVIRHLWILDRVDTSEPQTHGLPPVLTGTSHKLTNLTAGLLQFIRVDNQYRPVEQLAEPAKQERARNLRRGLRKIAKEAQVLREKQRRLIQEVTVALEGVSEDPSDVGDLAATFIRDDESHATIELLVGLYLDSLHRSERGE